MPRKDKISNSNSSSKSEFLWIREEKAGYSIKEGAGVSDEIVSLTKRSRVEPFLVRSESEERQIEYSPEEENPLMYREFAITKRDLESVVEFAKRYGILGIERELQISEGSQSTRIVGESIRSWYESMDDIANAISLWDSCVKDSSEELAQRIQWHQTKDDSVLMHNWDNPFFSDKTYSSIAADSRVDAPLAKSLKTLTIQEQAQFIVTQQINKYFDRYTSAKISLDQSAANKTPKVRVTPKNLLGWLWLQLAQEVTRETVYFECLNCGKPVLKKVTRGQPSKSCSASCRVQISQRKLKLDSE